MSSSTYEGKEFEQDIMICNPNLDILRNDIEFIFNNVKLKLKLSTLFKDRNGRPNKLHNFTGVILGYPFLSLFNYTVFDYQNKQFELYSDTYSIIDSSTSINFFLILYSIIVTLLIFNIIMLLCNIRKY